MSLFDRYVGIDYSGAQKAEAGLKGLRVYRAEGAIPPIEVAPPSSRYWSRRGIAEWLVEFLTEQPRTLVGIDHGFFFPLLYFQAHQLELDWPAFLDDFQRHWPTDERSTLSILFVKAKSAMALRDEGTLAGGAVTELRTRGAKSVFHFDVPGSVAKSDLMPEFHGCASFASKWGNVYISGRSTAGISQREGRP